MQRLRAWLPLSVTSPWILSRVLVLIALWLCTFTVSTFASLLAWDGAWYRDIARLGYAGAGEGAIRFFPLWPLLGRAVAAVTAQAPGPVLVALANLAALAYLALARRAALAVGVGEDAALLVPAVVAFAPAGAVLVMGYTEALFGVLVAIVLVTAPRRQWLPAAVAGLAAGALRPTGVLLALPVLLEAGRQLATTRGRELAARAVAVGAPVLGLAGYLGWAGWVDGDPLLPFRSQLDPHLRAGVVVDPVTSLVAGLRELAQGTVSVNVITHLVFVPVTLALLVVCVRRLPLSWSAFAAATVFLALTATSFRSFERYAASALPLLVALAIVLAEHRWLRRAAAFLGPLILFVVSAATFLGWYLP